MSYDGGGNTVTRAEFIRRKEKPASFYGSTREEKRKKKRNPELLYPAKLGVPLGLHLGLNHFVRILVKRDVHCYWVLALRTGTHTETDTETYT